LELRSNPDTEVHRIWTNWNV